MIRIKSGVQFSHVSFIYPDIMRIIYVVQKAAPDGYAVTITSGCDGKHSPRSKHYGGRAFDFRTRDFPEGKNPETWKTKIQNLLGSCYLVLLEKTHMHVQFNG